MSHRTRTSIHSWRERALSLLLAAALLVGLAPGAIPAASAHWADPYLDQLVDWGVMRADQTGDPDSPITRADFAAVINRAYGYDKMGPIPFTDVSTTDWFYDDIAIAYNAGYMAGTSGTTASPNSPLTREMAVCILGRNMMLRETPGESLAFSDSRDISGWARGTIKTAVDNYIVSGYPDNTFGPQDPITKGQMAVLVTQCVGQPVSESGSHSLGGVFGNVTITSPNVTLHDTTISGDLYISGGVGLGGILLQNVDVLGRIIVSGTGESETGAASVVMRNVTATEMLVDNLKNQYVTIRADGITQIGTTTVRTPSYLEDNNTDDKGLMEIVLDGEPGTRLDLAGRIKEVVNKTPNSIIQVAKGTVKKLTVDEDATSSTVQIDRNTEVKELNLDVGTNVVGDGDIGQLNVNAPGSTVSMLPDKIYIRPGLTANIAGVIMDHLSAEQGSTDPRRLSGYPAAKDIAPTGFRADFSGNKAGTIYWAVSAITDGSINEEDLISPPSYGNRAVRNGSITAPTGGSVVSAQVTGLTTGGSYYLSAVLVDGMDQRSPVKVVSFTTPDNTVPAFGQGYPYMSRVTRSDAQVTVMPTKSCKLYYALLPRGAQAPTVNELKSASVSGNLGYGVLDVVKNEELVFNVNSRRLEELTDYTLYLWLTDSNGANSSQVQALQFRTPDETPPTFIVDPYVNDIQATSVRLGGTLDENGTVYWVVVEAGTPYPKPNNQNAEDNTDDGLTARLDSDYAKLQVSSGMNSLRRGSVAAREDTEFTLSVTGLEAEKSYDLYYVARDTAGNYSAKVERITIHTLDTSGPIVIQSFSEVPNRTEPNRPMSSTDIILDFSENIRCEQVKGVNGPDDFRTLYENATSVGASDRDKNLFIEALQKSIVLYQMDISTGRSTPVPTKQDGETDWVVDYSQVTVTVSEGHLLVTFPGGRATNLANGAQYYFEINNLTDTSTANNRMTPRPLNYTNMAGTEHSLPAFNTVFAQVRLASPGIGPNDRPVGQNPNDLGETADGRARVDMSFRMSPESTENTEESNSFDILFFSDTTAAYELYYRIVDKEGKAVDSSKYEGNLIEDHTFPTGPDDNGWYYLGSADGNATGGEFARSLGEHFTGCDATNFPPLKRLNEELSYEFVISLTRNGISTDYPTWSGQVNFQVYVVAGQSSALADLATSPSRERLEAFVEAGLGSYNGGASIGTTMESTDYLRIRATFTDTNPPTFAAAFPTLSASKTGTGDSSTGNITLSQVGDTFAYMHVNLDRPGTIHYVVSPRYAGITTTLAGIDVGDVWDTVPTRGKSTADGKWEYVSAKDDTTAITVTSPRNIQVSEHEQYFKSYIRDSVPYNSAFSTDVIEVRDLQPETDYYVYFVLQGVSDQLSEVYAYKFRTSNISKPKIALDFIGNGLVNATTTNVPGDLDYVVYTAGNASNVQLLNQPLKNYSVGQLPPAYATYDDDDDPSTPEVDMTVLEAMLMPYNHATAQAGASAGDYFPQEGADFNGFSVFDAYGNESIKNSIATLIQQRNQGLIATGGNDIMTETNTPVVLNRLTVNVLEKLTPYTILVVGRHPASLEITSSYTFRAIENVIIPDQDPPAATTGTASIQADPTGGYKGTITISFDKELYWVESQTASTALEVWQGASTPGKSVDILDYVGRTCTVENASTIKHVTDTLNFRYSGMAIGESISIVNYGLLSNASRVPTSTDVICTLKEGSTTNPTTGLRVTGVYMEITWDGQVIGTSQTIPIT